MNHLLACPACGSAALENPQAGAGLTCSTCGATHPSVDGIVDFVAGRQRTVLDDMDYDAFYMVDAARGTSAFEILRQETGSLLRQPFKNVLELGAGTGLMTLAILEHATVENLVVTDVSLKMLSACRARIRAEFPASRTQLLFATNDGVHLGVAPGAFDLVLAYFVVHHVADYEQTLAAAFRAVNHRGVAVFVEPNGRFFQAMVQVLTRVIERLLPSMVDAPGSDLSKLMNLNNEWEFSLRHAENRAVLVTREDKHFFMRAAFEEACRKAGWPHVATLALHPEGGPLAAAKVFAKQLQLSPEGYTRFIDAFGSELPGPFGLLDWIDSSPSYVFLAARRGAEAELWRDALPRPVPAAVPLDPPLLGYTPRYDLEITVKTDPPYIDVQGWIAASRPARRVVVRAGDLCASFVVGLRRSDIHLALRHVWTIPFENALHSGVRFMDEGPVEPPAGVPDTLRVTVELDDGRELLLAERLRLHPKQDWRVARLTRVG
jgi:ubiquinone/menaquinone biosynthesis C-methylase UbiE